MAAGDLDVVLRRHHSAMIAPTWLFINVKPHMFEPWLLT